jgi:hypothetical protein
MSGDRLRLLRPLLLGSTAAVTVRYAVGVLFARHAARIVFNRLRAPSLRAVRNLLAVTRPGELLFRLSTALLRRRPAVFVLGETRCASTTLSALLRERLGFVGPFTPWVHPLADSKESFFFVGHYFGVVAPSLYRMCFPLRLSQWWERAVLGRPPRLCFDGCASYFSAPWVPALLKRVEASPVLIVCLREPVSQHVSWWRLEQNGMAWGSGMGLGEEWLDPPARLPGYPPRSLAEAVALSRSPANEARWREAEGAWQVGGACCGLLERLPEWAMPFPNGQLAAFDRMGRYADNLARWLDHFERSCFVFVTLDEIAKEPSAVLARVAAKCVEMLGESGSGVDAAAAREAMRRADADMEPSPPHGGGGGGAVSTRGTGRARDGQAADGGVHAPKLNASAPIDAALEPDERTLRELAAYYRPHNERLFRMIGRDLGWHDDPRFPWYRDDASPRP